MQAYKKHPMRHDIALGSKTDQAVNAVWAAMIYHTPALSNSLKAYGKAQLQSEVIQHLFCTCTPLFIPVLFYHSAVKLKVPVWFFVVDQECKPCLSDEFVQVYVFAESIRTWMVSVSFIVD